MDLNFELLSQLFDLSEIMIVNDHVLKEININVDSVDFYNYLLSKIGIDRLGEVVFALYKDNKVLLVRQNEYPKGIFRVPSGGIELNEKVLHALKREVYEELGYNINNTNLIGVIKYNLVYMNNVLTFYSFIFIIDNFIRDLNAELDGEISEIYYADINEFYSFLFKLREQKGFWGDWGKLRYESSFVVYEYLNK